MHYFARATAGFILLGTFAASLMLPSVGRAQSMPTSAAVTVDVWPGLAPGEKNAGLGHPSANASDPELLITDVSRPQLTVYKLSGGFPHPAVLVLPGGAYQVLAADKEGGEVARWLNGLGFVAAVLEYRVPDKREGAFQDGQRSLSLMRAHAAEWGIDPKRVGVIGFSAGGHLAARLSVGAGERSYAAVDASDMAGDRPDFTLLIYPAYLTRKAAQSTRESVAQAKPHAGMPPAFLAQTWDDYYLDAPDYAAQLSAAKVPVELHVYASGGHGYGLRAGKDVPASRWADAAAGWLGQFTTAAR